MYRHCDVSPAFMEGVFRRRPVTYLFCSFCYFTYFVILRVFDVSVSFMVSTCGHNLAKS